MTEVRLVTIEENELIQLIRTAVKCELQTLAKTQQKEPPIFLTREEVAKHIGLSLPTVDNLTKEGVLTAYRTGRKKAYILSEVNENIHKQKIKYK